MASSETTELMTPKIVLDDTCFSTAAGGQNLNHDRILLTLNQRVDYRALEESSNLDKPRSYC